MQLQGRNLAPGLNGEDVQLLQQELSQLQGLPHLDPAEVGHMSFGRSTQAAVHVFQTRAGLPPNGIVDQATATAINAAVAASTTSVNGHVSHADGSAAAGLAVNALRVGVGFHDETLGTAQTSDDGQYVIPYVAARNGGGPGPLTIVVTANDPDGTELARSNPAFNPPPTVTLDFTVPVGADAPPPSEFDVVQAALTPSLGDVAMSALDTSSIALASGSSGVNPHYISMLATAGKLQEAARIEGEPDISSQVFYALARQGLPTDLGALTAQHPEAIRGALGAAVSANLVPAEAIGDPNEIVRQLQQRAVGPALMPLEGPSSLATSLQLTPMTDAQKGAFVTAVLDHDGPIEAFWEQARGNPDLGGEQTVTQLQSALQLVTLAQGHVPLANAIFDRVDLADPSTFRNLAHVSHDEWVEIILTPVDGEPLGIPDGIPGDTPEERAANYAALLVAQVEAGYPTPSIAARISEGTLGGKDDLVLFFNANEGFDLLTDGVDAFLGNGAVLGGIADVDALRHDLKAVQRVAQISPHYADLEPLLLAGYDSAHAVAHTPPRRFFAEFEAHGGDPARAERMYAQARLTVAIVATAALKFGGALAPPQLLVTGDPASVVDQVPEWRELFPQSLAACSCDECRSVLGAAAYLTDLLAMLSRIAVDDGGGGGGAQTALDALRTRRPDVPRIELSCENTTTPVPYIDLVNEILENAVTATPDAVPVATRLPAEQVAATPEYTNEAAYAVLTGEIYPWTLPYQRGVEEVRQYLSHLRVARADLMFDMQRGTPADPTDAQIAGERLRFAPATQALVTGGAGRPAWELWGLTEHANDAPETEGSDTTIQLDWLDYLARADLLLKRADISFTELRDALSTRFLTGLSCAASEPLCALDQTRIDGLTSDSATRLYAFLRVENALGCSALDLDVMLTALGVGGTIDDQALTGLAEFQRLSTELRVDYPTCSSWVASIDTHPGLHDDEQVPSRYDTLFQNPSIIAADSPEFAVFTLNADRTELASVAAAAAGAAPAIADHADAVSAATGLSSADLALLQSEATADQETLALANLSRLLRHSTFARALRLRVGDLVSLIQLSGIDPFGATPAAVRRFLDALAVYRQSRADVRELEYVFQDDPDAAAVVGPQPQIVTARLQQIRDALRTVSAENAMPTGDDELVDAARAKLAIILEQADVDTAMMLLEGTWTASPDEQRAFIAEKFAVFVSDIAGAQAELVDATPPLEVPSRIRYVLTSLLAYLVRTLGMAVVQQQLGDAFKLDSSVAARLVTGLTDPNDPLRPLHQVFADPSFLSATDAPDAAGTPSQYAAYRLADKAASVLRGAAIAAEELDLAFDHFAVLGWPDLNSLPLTPQPGTWRGWNNLAEYAQVRDSLAPSRTALATALLSAIDGTGTVDALLADFASDAALDPAVLAAVTGPDGLALAFPADYRTAAAFKRVTTLFETVKLLGVPVDQARRWAAAAPADEEADAARRCVKAKYDPDEWVTVAPPLLAPIRSRRREALVDYVIRHENLVDTDRLYGRYLIDAEMEPCMLTSRIVQASASVQLFVQRALLGLEPGVSLSIDDERHWSWMKNYRVWQAAREVFLYPENWMEPELRTDKTPFFIELENDLTQAEVTNDAAERALLNYLEKLNTVARLDICGMYHQQELATDSAPAIDILHVFGSTHNEPRQFYYRTRVDSSYWTPWEKVDLDIDADQVVPVVYERRLYLFWPVVKQKAGTAPPNTDPSAAGAPAPSVWEIRLSWSQYTHDKWAHRRTSTAAIHADPRSSVDDRRAFTLQGGVTEDDSLVVHCFQTEPSARGGGVLIGSFVLDSCHGSISTVGAYTPSAGIVPTPDAQLAAGGFEANMGAGGQVHLTAGTFPDPLPAGGIAEAMRYRVSVPTLGSCFGDFRLVVPHQTHQFVFDAPFFFQDARRTYFVEATQVAEVIVWSRPNLITPPYALSGALIRAMEHPALVEPPHLDTTDGLGLARSQAVSDTRIDLGGGAGGRSIGSGSALVAGGVHSMMRIQRNGGGGIPMGPILGGDSTPDPLPPPPVHPVPPPDGGDPVPPGNIPGPWKVESYRFSSFGHPHVCAFIHELARDGIAGLLQRPTQSLALDDFQDKYQPFLNVDTRYPMDDVDFSPGGAYSIYNWELFFHVPMLIASRLTQNQQFEDAKKWAEFAFWPGAPASGGPPPARYWQTRPFFENPTGMPVQELEALLDAATADPAALALRDAFIHQIQRSMDDPFKPYLIAAARPLSYQQNVVMKYIENLIAWGDQLFSQDTRESVYEAIQLYILAAEILGPRPEDVKPSDETDSRSFDDISPVDDFSNAPVVRAENVILTPTARLPTIPPAGAVPPVPLLPLQYFRVPRNPKLLGYWDTVADRLTKIRSCEDITGVSQQLALFAPRIDPGLLVRAAAAGLPLSAVLADLSAPPPNYRFATLAAKANELIGDVRGLGASLLSALEKRDAEALAALRSSHEIALLQAVRTVKEQQISEAEATLDGLTKARESAQLRRDFYRSRQFMNTEEVAQIGLTVASTVVQAVGQIMQVASGGARLIPQFAGGGAGWAASPVVVIVEGGEQAGGALSAWATAMNVLASILSTGASVSGTLGGYRRRQDDWGLQGDLAQREMDQLDKQILAAEIRLAIASTELDNHDLQADQAADVAELLTSKFTNQELYDWMVSQVSGVYFQSYQLAYNLARKAERAYQLDTGDQQASFIGFGYWDSLRKGLIAGERLQQDVRRMEIAYLDANRREYELTKQISLALLDPLALINLKEAGSCVFNLPESSFDFDHPGHYFRRIKSLAVSVPCVTGPFTGVHVTATMLSGATRISTQHDDTYVSDDPAGDARFVTQAGVLGSISTSSGQNDSGLFDVNLRDERYLPFEGRGAISTWRLDLPLDAIQFDPESITDVVLTMRYTAREGGDDLRRTVIQEVLTAPPETELVRFVSLRQELPDAWYRFFNPDPDQQGQSVPLDLSAIRFPFWLRQKQLAIQKAGLAVKFATSDLQTEYQGHPTLTMSLTPPGAGPVNVAVNPSLPDFGGIPGGMSAPLGDTPLGTWTLALDEAVVMSLPTDMQAEVVVGGVTHHRLSEQVVDDIGVYLSYTY